MTRYQGRNKSTANLLKSIYFDYPEWTPCEVKIMPATWMKYREDLEELVLAHPRVFPYYKKGSRDFDAICGPMYELGQHTDCWGCVWENVERGMTGIPITRPLEHWSDLDDYVPPDPLNDDLFGPRIWEQVQRLLDDAPRRGDLAAAKPLPHGFLYMRLFYLRGFENLMIDFAMDDPRLLKLISMVEAYNIAVIRKYLDLGMEYAIFGEDLGLQTSLPMRPAMWRKYIKPPYERMFKPCLEAGVPVFLHTDGHILEIIPDLIEVGVQVLNPQFRANGLLGLKEVAKGKVAVCLDLDRQLFPFATPSEIESHIGEAHEELYLPEGGLMLYAECEPDVPLDNIDSICTALERTCNLPEP